MNLEMSEMLWQRVEGEIKRLREMVMILWVCYVNPENRDLIRNTQHHL